MDTKRSKQPTEVKIQKFTFRGDLLSPLIFAKQ